jgi:hypothetical protein
MKFVLAFTSARTSTFILDYNPAFVCLIASFRKISPYPQTAIFPLLVIENVRFIILAYWSSNWSLNWSLNWILKNCTKAASLFTIVLHNYSFGVGILFGILPLAPSKRIFTNPITIF